MNSLIAQCCAVEDFNVDVILLQHVSQLGKTQWYWNARAHHLPDWLEWLDQ